MKNLLIDEIKKALEKLEISGVDVEISKPAQAENGDFSSNIAMKLAKSLRKNPMEIADMIAKNIDNENIKSIEIKAPGFINFFVSKEYLLENINKVLEEKENYGRSNIGNGKKINIEFVSCSYPIPASSARCSCNPCPPFR